MTVEPAPAHSPPAPIEHEVRALWMLDFSITFLNHGAFGARLRSVCEAQQARRRELEARPVEFLDRRSPDLLEQAKRPLGQFLGMNPANFGFVTNATEGVNAVLRSLTFGAGDELLTTDHVYPAVRKTLRYVASRSGAEPVEAAIPLPVGSPDEIVDAVASHITGRTKIVIVDHITSITAIVFPVKRIIELCAERGVDVLVDGAHAPGMLEVNIEQLGAAYYVGNLHKWVCAPPGAAFVWVRPDRQADIHPTVISHSYGEGLSREFSWQATRDVSAWLTVPEALRQMHALAAPEGWLRIMRHNHELAVWMQAMLCEAWQTAPNSPIDGSMLGSMAAITLPSGVDRLGSQKELKRALYETHRIEVPVIEDSDPWLIRPCCQVYNSPEQYHRLARAVAELAR